MTPDSLPFRLGATSYVYEADLVTNARRLAGQVEDVELVLFHTPVASNLPDETTVAALAGLADQTGLSYTVHLPGDAGATPSTELALQTIHTTRPMAPWGYVVHLSAPEEMADLPAPTMTHGQPSAWLNTMRPALDRMAQAAGSYELLCLENLDGWPPEFFLSMLDEVPVSLCIDIGHLWRQGRDPVPYLADHLPRARIIHLHGCDGNGVDHQALPVMPDDALWSILSALRDFRGVLTMEVFGLTHFKASRAKLLEIWERVETWREPN